MISSIYLLKLQLLTYVALMIVTKQTFGSAEQFSQISIVWFGPNDRTFFLQNTLFDKMGNLKLSSLLYFSALVSAVAVYLAHNHYDGILQYAL